MKPISRLLAVVALTSMAACGGSADSGTTTPPGGTGGNPGGNTGGNTGGGTVASVAITSTSADSMFSFRDTVHINAVARDASGNGLSTATISWASSDPAVATVSPSSGPSTTVTGLANGAVTITATSGSFTATKVLVIAQRPASLVISPSPADSIFALGDSKTFSASVRDARGSGIANGAVTWSIDKTSIATISATSGVNTIATAVANGSAILTARSGTLSSATGVVVRQKVAQLVVTPNPIAISLGQSVFLIVVAKDAHGNTMLQLPALQFASSNPSVARVDSLGVITGVTTGTANITVTQPTVDGDVKMTIPLAVAAYATALNVDILDFEFAPVNVDIVANGKVTWTWKGQTFHDVTGQGTGNPIKGPLQGLGTYTVQFTTPGKYSYLCTQHPFMTGSVTVH